MLRKIFALAAIGAVIVTLSACGGDDAPPAPGALPADEITTITWTNWESGDGLLVFQSLVADFEAQNPDIRINFVNIPEEYDTRLTAMIAAGDPPDVSILESATMLYPLASEGMLANLLTLVDADPNFSMDYLLPALRFMYDEDTMIGYGVGPQVMMMFYNPSLLDAAGVPRPPARYADAWDWDTFVNYARILTIDNNGNNANSPDFNPDNIRQFGVSGARWWAVWMPFVFSAGGHFLAPDGQSLGLLEPAALGALQNFADLTNVHHVMPTPEMAGALPGLAEAFVTGRVAMHFGGHWINTTLMTDGVDYGVAALPRVGDRARTMAVSGSLSIFDNENVDASWRFFAYMFTENENLLLERAGLWLPSIAALYYDENLDLWVTDNHPAGYVYSAVHPMRDSTAMPPVTGTIVNFSRIIEIVAPALDYVWSGDMTVQQALEGIEDSIQQFIEGFRFVE